MSGVEHGFNAIKPPVTSRQGTGAVIPFSLAKHTIIGTGTEAIVHRSTVVTDAGQRVFAYKEYKRPGINKAKAVAELYARCKAAGLPVPETYRIVTDEQGKGTGFLMTDLTNGGENLVISAQDVIGQFIGFEDVYTDPFNQATEAQKRAFAKVDFAKVKAIMVEIAGRATNAGLLFGASDELVLVVTPQGEAEVVISDPAAMSYGTYSDDTFEIQDRGPMSGVSIREYTPGALDRSYVANKNYKLTMSVAELLESYQSGEEGLKAYVREHRVGGSYDRKKLDKWLGVGSSPSSYIYLTK